MVQRLVTVEYPEVTQELIPRSLKFFDENDLEVKRSGISPEFQAPV